MSNKRTTNKVSLQASSKTSEALRNVTIEDVFKLVKEHNQLLKELLLNSLASWKPLSQHEWLDYPENKRRVAEEVRRLEAQYFPDVAEKRKLNDIIHLICIDAEGATAIYDKNGDEIDEEETGLILGERYTSSGTAVDRNGKHCYRITELGGALKFVERFYVSKKKR